MNIPELKEDYAFPVDPLKDEILDILKQWWIEISIFILVINVIIICCCCCCYCCRQSTPVVREMEPGSIV